MVAVLVKEEDRSTLENKLETIRKRYFQTGEMKSNKLKPTEEGHRRRKLILNKIKGLPFKVFVLSVDKIKLWETSGMARNKTVFYKFFNNYLYNELRKDFRELEFLSDQVGGSEYTQDFIKYLKKKSQQITFFDDYSYGVTDSKDNIIVQLADLIAGSISYSLDKVRSSKNLGNNYLELLEEHILTIRSFPIEYDKYNIPQSSDSKNYNPQIAEIAYRRAIDYIRQNDTSKMECLVLKYLLFRFMYNSHRQYISTKEIIGYLNRMGYNRLSPYTLRLQAIAPLRDAGVIIASSSKGGYKLPTTMEEVRDFLNHGQNIIIPMLNRLQKCIEAFRIASAGTIDLGKEREFSDLMAILIKHSAHQNQ